MSDISITSIVTLIFLEIILSIDNLIFIATISSKMKGRYKELTKIVGLSLAFGMRILLLMFMDFVFKIKATFIHLGSIEITYKEFIFIAGGLLLIYKSGLESKKIILAEDENNHHDETQIIDAKNSEIKNFLYAIFQITFIDLIFSVDSVIVAIALVPDIKIVIFAVSISILTLFFSVNKLADTLDKYPNIRLLAMIFIIGVGALFILHGFEIYVSKNYLNVAFFFSIIFVICDIIRSRNTEKKSLNKKIE